MFTMIFGRGVFLVAVFNIATFHFGCLCSASTLWRTGEKPVRLILLFVHGVGSLWTVYVVDT